MKDTGQEIFVPNKSNNKPKSREDGKTPRKKIKKVRVPTSQPDEIIVDDPYSDEEWIGRALPDYDFE